MRSHRSLLLLALALGACAAPPPPRLAGLGHYQRVVTTASQDARDFFLQGLALKYGFNHAEAVAAYEHAAELDPSFAMAHWGVAHALGPNINSPMTDVDVAERAFDESRRALALAERATPVEQALIAALAHRYASPPPVDRAALDQAFADAMADVWARFPDDADVGTLYADALLNLSPWDQWETDGTPKANTETILATLAAVRAFAPDHAGACHFTIHATEASRTPELGEAAADRLRDLVPGQGHLVHMPGHTYIRIGRYADAAECNRLALIADNAYFALRGPQQEYELYRAHNYHFRAYAAMFQGDPDGAMEAARGLVHDLPRWVIENMPENAEGFLAVPWHVMVRFGMWDAILAEPLPDTPLTVAGSLWHYARGVAFANLGRLDEAEGELAAFELSAAPVTNDEKVGVSEAAKVLDIARQMLLGELRYRQDRQAEALDHLRTSVELDDALPYNEPRGWMQPARHALGALLMESGELQEAEAVYRADLEWHPENGWALHGLAECLERRDATREAAAVRERFEQAWGRATIEITASCYCRRAAE